MSYKVMDWKKIKNDLLLVSFSHFLYKIIGYSVLTILTRYLTKGEMGEFFFAVSISSFFALFTQLGTDNYLVREAAAKPSQALQRFSEIVTVRLLLFILYFILLNGFIITFKSELSEVVFLTSIYIILEQLYNTFGSLFVGVKQVKYNVISGVVSRIFLVGIIYLIIRLNGSLTTIIICYIVANTLLVVISVLLLKWKIGSFKLTFKLNSAFKILQESFPLFILTLLGLILFKIDTLMLGFIKSYPIVAAYEAAYKLFEASQFLIMPLGMIFSPIFSEMASNSNWVEILRYVKKILIILTIIGSFTALLVITTAGYIIPFVFGDKYPDSISILKILYLTVPVLYLANINIILAKSIFLEKKAIKILLISTILNILLNSFSIPLWGAIGAAWATFISETILAVVIIKMNLNELRFQISKVPVKLMRVLDHA